MSKPQEIREQHTLAVLTDNEPTGLIATLRLPASAAAVLPAKA